ncbi:MAG TPA: hypothetical protein VJR58_25740 [Vineibacter sp.]|nr:hypothetical protein [Vineibacter sp.]
MLAVHDVFDDRTGRTDARQWVADHGDLGATLSQLAMAVFLVNGAGHNLLINATAETLVCAGDGLRVVNRRLCAADANANKALQQAIHRAIAHDHRQAPVAADIAVPRVGRHPLLLSIAPLDGRGNPACAAVMVVAMDPEARGLAWLDGIVRAYGLTAAESRLLGAIVDGEGVGAAAARLGIARTTAKTHLQHIFAKTFTSRQAELIRLVAYAAAPLQRRPGACHLSCAATAAHHWQHNRSSDHTRQAASDLTAHGASARTPRLVATTSSNARPAAPRAG